MPAITLYKCADDPRKLYKTLTGAKALTAQIKDAASIMSPTFYINYDADLLSQHYNYAEAWGRYYFIDDMTIDIGGSIYIKCREDVIHTFADQIIRCPIIAERSDSAYNAFISDPQRRYYQYTNHQYIEIEDLGKPNTICMLTVG